MSLAGSRGHGGSAGFGSMAMFSTIQCDNFFFVSSLTEIFTVLYFWIDIS